jgi:hypothetical protein
MNSLQLADFANLSQLEKKAMIDQLKSEKIRKRT